MKTSRLNYSVAVNGNKVYIVGGFDEYKRKYLKSVEVITMVGE